MDVADRLRRARLTAGLTQAEVAGGLGLKQPQIAAYESRRKRPTFDTARRILVAIGVRPSDLVAAHRAEAREALAARFGTTASPRLFGSVARGDDSVDSDIDLLISVPAGTRFVDLDDAEDELEAIFGADVDVITDGGLDPLR